MAKETDTQDPIRETDPPTFVMGTGQTSKICGPVVTPSEPEETQDEE